MEKRKTVEIPDELMESDWKTNKVVIKRLTYQENLRVRDEASRIRISESGASGTVSQEAAALGMLLKAIVEAPWQTKNVNVYANMDAGLGNWLTIEVNDFNSVQLKKKTESGGQ